MLLTGIILAPPLQLPVTPAVQDLTDLRTIINGAANIIGSKTNSSRNWGWGFLGGNPGEMGTADLINNITATILHAKYSLDTNRTSWLADPLNPSLPLDNLTLPLTSSIALPTSLPTIIPRLLPTDPLPNDPPISLPTSALPEVPQTGIPTDGLPNVPPQVLPSDVPDSPPVSLPADLPTSSMLDVPLPPQPSPESLLSTPYTSYVSSIPNLSTSLIALGRAWHAEMNAPVHAAIDALQQAISEFSATMLEFELIDGPAVLRTIRASSSLEDAQQAWSRFLNLPGKAGDEDDKEEEESGSGGVHRNVGRDPMRGLTWTLVGAERYHSHRELWGGRVLERASRALLARPFVA